jgi:hypothetical protein
MLLRKMFHCTRLGVETNECSVDRVLESIKAGRRLPEVRFAVNLGSQRSVLGYM